MKFLICFFISLSVFGQTIDLKSPSMGQAFQRVGNGRNVPIFGTYSNPPNGGLQYSLNGSSFITVTSRVLQSNFFSGIIFGIPTGYHTIQLRSGNGATFSQTNSFQVGDIFVLAGQSNASGKGTNVYPYSVSIFTGEERWEYGFLPVDRSSCQRDYISLDSSAGGNFITFLAEYLSDTTIPVAFITCPKGGTSSTDWQPGVNRFDQTTLFGSMNRRIAMAGGAKCVLWWQGEKDANLHVSEADYRSNLVNIASALSIPIMPFKLHTIFNTPPTNQSRINAAIESLWGDKGFITGPDLTDLMAEDASGNHLISDWGLQTVGYRVSEKLKFHFYQ